MSKEYDYIVTLKKLDARLFDYVSQFMLFFAFIAFTAIGITTANTLSQVYFILGGLLLVSWLHARFISKLPAVSFRIPFLIAILGLIYLPGWFKLFAALYIIAFLLEKQVKLPQEIGVDKDGVSFNNFPLKTYSWDKLNNVVIKDGLITIDFKNNKLFQKDIESEVSPEMEKEFNEFCSSKLLASNTAQ